MGKNRDATKADFSSFMCIILMLTGALVTILVSNVIVVAANPQNVQITSIMAAGLNESEGGGQLPVTIINGNVMKNPWYVEVQRDHLVIYPGETLVNMKDLEERDNSFEQLLTRVSLRTNDMYIVLMVRPYASSVARQLKKIILDRGIEIGIDLLEKDLPIEFGNVSTNETAAATRK